eukprot:9504117-Pyramimonas_sp.AAC.1
MNIAYLVQTRPTDSRRVSRQVGEFVDVGFSLLRNEINNMGVLTWPAALYYYTFMGIVFLVVLNFLLAIVVDAFTSIKEQNAKQRVGVANQPLQTTHTLTDHTPTRHRGGVTSAWLVGNRWARRESSARSMKSARGASSTASQSATARRAGWTSLRTTLPHWRIKSAASPSR